MAKLYFRYGAMGSSKTANAVMVQYNYRGARAAGAHAQAEDRKSGRSDRCALPAAGWWRNAAMSKELGGIDLTGIDCIIVDECHFMNAAQVRQLVDIVDEREIPVICYGLRTDFRGELFEGRPRVAALGGHHRGNQDRLLVRPQGDVQCARAERAHRPRGRADYDGRQFRLRQPLPPPLEGRKPRFVLQFEFGRLNFIKIESPAYAKWAGDSMFENAVKSYSASAVSILASTFSLSSTNACLVRPAETPGQRTFSRAKKPSPQGRCGEGVAEEMRVGQIEPVLQRLAVKAGANGGVEKRLARAELLKLMRAKQQRTFLFRQVKTTSLSESSWSSGFIGHARLFGLRLAGAAVTRNLCAHEGQRVRDHSAGNA